MNMEFEVHTDINGVDWAYVNSPSENRYRYEIKDGNKETWRYIGEVSVDSGHVGIIDPCYIDKGYSGEKVREEFERLGVRHKTPFGDGGYPVYVLDAHVDNFGVKQVEMKIIFVGKEEK